MDGDEVRGRSQRPWTVWRITRRIWTWAGCIIADGGIFTCWRFLSATLRLPWTPISIVFAMDNIGMACFWAFGLTDGDFSTLLPARRRGVGDVSGGGGAARCSRRHGASGDFFPRCTLPLYRAYTAGLATLYHIFMLPLRVAALLRAAFPWRQGWRRRGRRNAVVAISLCGAGEQPSVWFFGSAVQRHCGLR